MNLPEIFVGKKQNSVTCFSADKCIRILVLSNLLSYPLDFEFKWCRLVCTEPDSGLGGDSASSLFQNYSGKVFSTKYLYIVHILYREVEVTFTFFFYPGWKISYCN